MPLHFFFGAIDLDFSTAIRANVEAQDYTVAPRHWYLDARFRCGACNAEFVWSAKEQQAWFETYRFYVDSQPNLCRDGRANRRDLPVQNSLRTELSAGGRDGCRTPATLKLTATTARADSDRWPGRAGLTASVARRGSAKTFFAELGGSGQLDGATAVCKNVVILDASMDLRILARCDLRTSCTARF